MKKKELMLFLEEGLTIEEVPLLTVLDEINDIIEKSNYGDAIKKELKQGINQMKRETINHSKLFTELLSSATKSDKNEY